MAQRRMFSPDIVNSDAFLEMEPSIQALYFQLVMRADDDGFVNPKMVMRMMGTSSEDLKTLITKRFLLSFENGLVVIKHWLIHNLIRADMYKETLYKKEKATLGLNENGAYTELREGVNEIKKIETPKWLKIRRKEERTADVPQTVCKVRLGKVRLGKESIESTTLAINPKEDITQKLINFSNNEFKLYEEQIRTISFQWQKTPNEIKRELVKFGNYWLEKDLKGNHRFYGQKYFEISKRISTWLNRTWGNKPKVEEIKKQIENKRSNYDAVDIKSILEKRI